MRASKETLQHSLIELVRDLTIVVAAQLALCALVRMGGLCAISDDDYARVVIAQEFAHSPSWDPAGTSWLPLPFWVTGGALMIGDASLDQARLISLILSCLSAVTLYFSAALLGCRGYFRVIAAVGAASIPYAAFLAIATVPEYPTAAAIVFGASSLYRSQQGVEVPDSRLRVLGALIVAGATASRYEAWPAALAVSAWNFWDFIQLKRQGRSPRIWLLVSAVVASCFLIIWPIHGAVNHDHAFFFVNRVVDYKVALGEASSSLLSSALVYPLALILQEPELILATVLGSAGIFLARRGTATLSALLRPWSVIGMLVLVLIVSAIRGGAPTHHPERALLSFWLMLALSFAQLLSNNPPLVIRASSLALLGAVLGVSLRWQGFSPREPFTQRKAEEAMGRKLDSLLGQEAQVAILPPDFGYFAVMSAAGTPARFKVLESHDPRDESHKAKGEQELQKWLRGGGCAFIAPRATPRPAATVLHEEGNLRLFRSHRCDDRSAR